MRLACLIAAAVVASAAPAAFAQTPATPAAAAAAAAPDVWLANNGKTAGVKTLPDGLQYKVVASGPAGPSPKAGDIIKVHYEGALTTGEVFDSSFQGNRPAIMQLADLVPGWMEAIPQMKVGDEWMLYLPPALGYGPEGAGPIPPNSVLVFRIKLLGMLSAD